MKRPLPWKDPVRAQALVDLAARRIVVFDGAMGTGIQALNQARTQYLQTVIEFNRAQFRLFTALGQPAECGLGTGVAQPLSIPAVPPPPERGTPVPAPKKV